MKETEFIHLLIAGLGALGGVIGILWFALERRNETIRLLYERIYEIYKAMAEKKNLARRERDS